MIFIYDGIKTLPLIGSTKTYGFHHLISIPSIGLCRYGRWDTISWNCFVLTTTSWYILYLFVTNFMALRILSNFKGSLIRRKFINQPNRRRVVIQKLSAIPYASGDASFKLLVQRRQVSNKQQNWLHTITSKSDRILSTFSRHPVGTVRSNFSMKPIRTEDISHRKKPFINILKNYTSYTRSLFGKL